MREFRSPFSFDFTSSPEARSAAAVSRQLIEAGYQAVLAGGAVRDMLLGRTPKDFDIATDAHPKKVLAIFKNTRKVGIAFGVVLVTDYESTIEVATFRSDLEYKDGRRPESVVFTDAQTDAQRRDFTINGLFYDVEQKEIIDYVNGRDDLEDMVIRAIGAAPLRFSEDYLRMLRAVRFAITLDFAIEPETWQALQQFAPQLIHVASDRIHEELRRTFLQGRSDLALEYLVESGLLQTFLPEAEFDGVWKGRAFIFSKGGTLPVIMAMLLSGQTKLALVAIAERLRLTNPEKQELLLLCKNIPQLENYEKLTLASRKRMIREHQGDSLKFIMERIVVLRPQRELLFLDLKRWTPEDLAPSWMPLGKDLIALGLKPGPEMGQMLWDLEELVLNEHLKTREACLDEVVRWIQEKTSQSPSD
jgi:poly(A) polymerase